LLAIVANSELHVLSAGKAAPALALRQQSQQLLREVLRHGKATGALGIDDEVLAAVAIGSMGLRVASWFGPDQPHTGEQVADAFAGFALRMVSAPVPSQPEQKYR